MSDEGSGEGMRTGAGKYRSEAETLLAMHRAEGVVVCIMGGVRGTGFSLATTDGSVLGSLPEALRFIADQIEIETSGGGG